MALSVVLIEDDEALAHAIKAALERTGMMVASYSDPPGPQELLTHSPDILILDCILGTTSGPDYLNQVRQHVAGNLAVVLTTGYHELLQQLKPLESPSLALLQKPFTAEALLNTMQRLLQQQPA